MKKVIISLILFLSVITTAQSRVVSLEDKITGLYVAYFYRAADAEGLQYWKNKGDEALASGKNTSITLRQLSANFAKHNIFTSHYGRLSNYNFVREIYKNILDREGDSEGINYWTTLLNNEMSRSTMVADFVNISLSVDLTKKNFPDLGEVELIMAQMRQDFFINKVKVALYFTKRLGARSNVINTIAPENDPAYLASINILRGITRKPITVANRLAYIETILSDDDPICGINLPLGSCGRNLAPVVNAGADKNVTINISNDIIGTATDSDGSIVEYEWKEGTTVIGHSASLNYIPTVLGVHTLTLIATDNDSAMKSDSVKITVVANQPPIANAGPDILNAFSGTGLTITGTGIDNDGSITRYEWKEGTTLLSNSPAFSYTPTTEGEHNLTLTVVDDKGLIDTDTMTLVATINTPPVADAGSDKTATTNHAITITGTGTDNDGTISSYRWKEGATVLATTASFEYTPTSIGDHTLTLTVTDNGEVSHSDEVLITVVANQAPTVEAGADINGLVNSTHSLTCTASDVDGDIITYQWTNGTNTILSNNASFSYTIIENDTLTCRVVDNDGDSTTDSLTVTEDP